MVGGKVMGRVIVEVNKKNKYLFSYHLSINHLSIIYLSSLSNHKAQPTNDHT